jgi:pimeloyl-ACP methyl ester carboxylesterase
MKALALRLVGALLFLSALAMWAFRAPDRPVETLVARWASPPSAFIDLDGQLVHLRDEGPRDDPEPVVLLHGTSSSLHTWDGWAKALRATRRVIRFDLPAFGLTGPNASGDYRGDTYARFVLALLDRLAVRRFVLAGNSLGGEVAWRTAVLAPQRVAQLILVDAAGPDFRSDSVPVGFVIARVPLLNRAFEFVLPRAVVAASLHNVYGDPSRITPELVDRHYELALREGNRRALGQRMQQVQRGADAERIATIRVPTLILWGGRDRLVPPSVAKAFEAAIPGSEGVIFDDLGHVPHEEDPARTVAAVQAFLARQRP